MWKFLESEMQVILGLVEDATRTDAEIADIFGLKKGTVASIRRRLLDAGAIAYVNVPAFNKLGCEAVGFHVGTIEPSERMDTRVNHYIEFTAKSPQVFHGMIGGTSIALFTALRNATEFDRFVQSHNSFFTGSRRSSKGRMASVIFPYALSRFTHVPNFAAIIHDHFQLDTPAPKTIVPSGAEVETPDLSETERMTLVALVEHPRSSDREIASMVGLSRQAVTRIRNKLGENGVLKAVCIPRLYKWGFEICAIAHPKFNMEIPWEKRIRTEPASSLSLSFMTLSKADEAVANYIMPKYTDYAERLETVLTWYHKVKAFDEKLDVTLFPLERCTELRSFDYGPAVRHLMLA